MQIQDLRILVMPKNLTDIKDQVLFGSKIFSFFPETLQICGLYDMIQGVVATVGRPIQNSLPRVLGGRDRFLRRADFNF